MTTLSISGIGGGSTVTTQLSPEPSASSESARSIPTTSDSSQSVPWSAPTADLPPIAASAAFEASLAVDYGQLRGFVQHHIDEARAHFQTMFPEQVGQLRGADIDEQLLNQMLDAIDNAFGEDKED